MQASTADNACAQNAYCMDESHMSATELHGPRACITATATATGNASDSLTRCNNRARLFQIAALLGQPGVDNICATSD